MGLAKDLQEIENLKGEISRDSQKAGREFSNLRERIIKGETTGNRKIDFAIVTAGSEYQRYGGLYNDLSRRVNPNVGQQVLVVNEKIETYSRKQGCFGGGGFSSHAEPTLRLGILSSEIKFEIGDGKTGLILGKGNPPNEYKGPRVILPTEKFVAYDYPGVHSGRDLASSLVLPPEKEWRISEANISIHPLDFYEFDVSRDLNGNSTKAEFGGFTSDADKHNTRRRLLIMAGNDNVKKYFESPKVIGYRSEKDTSYVQALDLLGIGDQVPEDFRKAYDKQNYTLRFDIINDLDKLRIDKNPDNEARIKSLLEKAVQLGMHQTPWELKRGLGTTTNVPEYITELREIYLSVK